MNGCQESTDRIVVDMKYNENSDLCGSKKLLTPSALAGFDSSNLCQLMN